VLALPERVLERSLAYSPDGKTLAVIGGGMSLARTWDTASGKFVHAFGQGHLAAVTCLAYQPDGKRLATGSHDRVVKVWDVATGELVFTVEKKHAGPGPVLSIAFSPDGKYLASSGGDVRVWEAATGKEIASLKLAPGGGLLNLVFSPDGSLLTGTNGKKVVQVYEVLTGEHQFSLEGHTSPATCVVFSPDGKRLASAAHDGQIKIWDRATGEYLLTLKAHSAVIESLVFSPDGKRLVSASKDHTIRLWEAGQFSQEELPPPNDTNDKCWAIVRKAGATPEDYRRAVERMKAVWSQQPMNGHYLNTLGVAQYRAGDYAAALRTLKRSYQLNAKETPGGNPADLAFLAMTYHRLGPEKKLLAHAKLQRARDAVQNPRWINDNQARELVQEAERLLSGPQK
jgi:WD40 repeat protein